MAISRKRGRQEAEDSWAECPFQIDHPTPGGLEKIIRRKRKTMATQEKPRGRSSLHLQVFPFSPSGKFEDPSNNMNRQYMVTPSQKWADMTRYNSFVLNGVKHYTGGYVFVANSSTVERQRNPIIAAKETRRYLLDDWVARVLEIRASDEHHVYARVCWMYLPHELPPLCTMAGVRVSPGMQAYHGATEVIASNHMDIINVVSVMGMANVTQWDELSNDPIESELYWRQAIDTRTMELTSLEPRCKCGQPENPDKTLIHCSNLKCKMWLHDDCIIHETLLATVERLGKTKPHRGSSLNYHYGDDEADSFSPSDSEMQVMKSAIKVEVGREIGLCLDSDSSLSELGSETPDHIPKSSPSRLTKSRMARNKSEEAKAEIYKGSFEAAVRDDLSPPVLEVKDLRKYIKGGENSWTQAISCLVCKKIIK